MTEPWPLSRVIDVEPCPLGPSTLSPANTCADADEGEAATLRRGDIVSNTPWSVVEDSLASWIQRSSTRVSVAETADWSAWTRTSCSARIWSRRSDSRAATRSSTPGSTDASGTRSMAARRDGGVAAGAAGLPIRESALPLRILVIESSVELFLRLLDLVHEEFGVRIHGAEGSLTASVMAMRRIGGQDSN